MIEEYGHILLDVLTDGLFAAIAGIGFGAISDPPLRVFKYIAFLAAIGHALRFCLINLLSIDIATASFFAASLIGFVSLALGKRGKCPMTVLYIPALLPMIPGKFAYNVVFSLIMALQSLNNQVEMNKYMSDFFSNSLVTFSVLFALTIGATLPMLLYPKLAYSLTRS